MPTEPPSVIEIPDDTPITEWIEDEWIGKGKIYPASDVPLVIQMARSRVLAIPLTYTMYLPSRQLSITDFLKAELPVQSSALISIAAINVFSTEEPNEDITCLKTRPIPPKEWLDKLEKAFGQAWFNGAWSIVDPRYKSSHLPLWVLTYWREMKSVIEKRSIWQSAEAWLARWGKEGKELEEADRVWEMMSSLTWGLDVTALGAGSPKDSLTVLLSNNWINGGTIDMMMSQLAARVRLDPNLRKTTVVATLSLQAQINKAYKDKDYSRSSVPLLSRYTAKSDSHSTKTSLLSSMAEYLIDVARHDCMLNLTLTLKHF